MELAISARVGSRVSFIAVLLVKKVVLSRRKSVRNSPRMGGARFYEVLVGACKGPWRSPSGSLLRLQGRPHREIRVFENRLPRLSN